VAGLKRGSQLSKRSDCFNVQWEALSVKRVERCKESRPGLLQGDKSHRSVSALPGYSAVSCSHPFPAPAPAPAELRQVLARGLFLARAGVSVLSRVWRAAFTIFALLLVPLCAAYAEKPLFDFDCGPDPAQVMARHAAGEPAEWWETVRQEHADRRARLQRLAEQAGGERPEFFDACVKGIELGGRRSTDIPLLRVVFPDRVFFDIDSAEIRPEALRILEIVSASLSREPPDVTLFVAGHTDSTGPEDYNLELSKRRAEAVARGLVARGVGASQVWRVGFGETMPIRDNATEEGRGANRRVEFLFAALPTVIVKWLEEQRVDACYFRESAEQRCTVPATRPREVLAERVPPEARDSHAPVKPATPDKRVARAPRPNKTAVRPAQPEIIIIRLPDLTVPVPPSRL
jgi:outer membrane protein OmpA-like peptidoglycan-associated protein